jgi:catechol 2,3-dioxygenase-like lactoylglutathione lyase family enzyme
MKRMHVHIGVEDLDRSINFYSALFAAQPTVVKPDYAKWILDACGGQAPTAERTVGPARMITESLTPKPGIREPRREQWARQG